MDESEVIVIIDEVLPRIEGHYGYSKFNREMTPWVILEIDDEDNSPIHAEFVRHQNTIIIYYEKMMDREHIIKTLVHEYQHYLQSPSWMKRYYNMGYSYADHPYELAAHHEERNWELFDT